MEDDRAHKVAPIASSSSSSAQSSGMKVPVGSREGGGTGAEDVRSSASETDMGYRPPPTSLRNESTGYDQRRETSSMDYSTYPTGYSTFSHPRQQAFPTAVQRSPYDHPIVDLSDRYYRAQSDRYPPPDEFHRSPRQSSSHQPNRDPSVPPPQRPPPPFFDVQPRPSTSSSSGRTDLRPPPSPPQSRGAGPTPRFTEYGHNRDRPEFQRNDHGYERRLTSSSGRLPSPPASRGEVPASLDRTSRKPSPPPLLPIPAYSPRAQPTQYRPFVDERVRSRSHDPANQSSSNRPKLRSRTSSEASYQDDLDDGGDEGVGEAGSQAPAPGYNPSLQRPKRTRVLMTHNQQHSLSTLWKTSKFPSTQDRERIAQDVGLTPRQVQVWFQNRRQTFRKQIQSNTVPESADPADYSDLQKSPRSRRLSLEATNAQDDPEAERGGDWASTGSPSVRSQEQMPTRVQRQAPRAISMLTEPLDPTLPQPPSSGDLSVNSRETDSPRYQRYPDSQRHLQGPDDSAEERPTSSWRPSTGYSNPRPQSRQLESATPSWSTGMSSYPSSVPTRHSYSRQGDDSHSPYRSLPSTSPVAGSRPFSQQGRLDSPHNPHHLIAPRLSSSSWERSGSRNSVGVMMPTKSPLPYSPPPTAENYQTFPFPPSHRPGSSSTSSPSKYYPSDVVSSFSQDTRNQRFKSREDRESEFRVSRRHTSQETFSYNISDADRPGGMNLQRPQSSAPLQFQRYPSDVDRASDHNGTPPLPSHLPPNLAKLTLARPRDQANTSGGSGGNSPTVLPSLSSLLDAAGQTPQMRPDSRHSLANVSTPGSGEGDTRKGSPSILGLGGLDEPRSTPFNRSTPPVPPITHKDSGAASGKEEIIGGSPARHVGGGMDDTARGDKPTSPIPKISSLPRFSDLFHH